MGITDIQPSATMQFEIDTRDNLVEPKFGLFPEGAGLVDVTETDIIKQLSNKELLDLRQVFVSAISQSSSGVGTSQSIAGNMAESQKRASARGTTLTQKATGSGLSPQERQRQLADGLQLRSIFSVVKDSVSILAMDSATVDTQGVVADKRLQFNTAEQSAADTRLVQSKADSFGQYTRLQSFITDIIDVELTARGIPIPV